jgi:hypothetical protein
MFKWIRIRAGSANFYPHNTLSVLPKHTRHTLPFQSVVVLLVVSPISYADPHNSTSVRGFKVHRSGLRTPARPQLRKRIYIIVVLTSLRSQGDPSLCLSLGERPQLPFTTRVQRRLVHLVYLVCLVSRTENSSKRTR